MKAIGNEEFISVVVEQLIKDFLQALQNLSGETNYYSHVGSLAEILDWAKDFCEQYHDKFINDKFSANAKNDIQDDIVLQSLVLSFGWKRLLNFYKKQNTNSHWGFVEKYSSLQK